jgi:hypothetical protein
MMPAGKQIRKNRDNQAQVIENPPPSDGPQLEQLDWNAVENAEFVADSMPENGDLRFRTGEDQGPTESPEEEDDNAYQESDEALPDDEEERAIRERNKSQDYRLPRP